jgi:hypothetical protein
MFWSFFSTTFRGSSAVLCAVIIPPADLRSLSLYYYTVCGCLCMSSVNCSQADHQQTRTPNTHRWHTHADTYCVIIQTQQTQISGRNNNGTKHNGGPPEDGQEKWPKHVGFYTYKHVFNILLVLNVKVWIVHELDCVTNITQVSDDCGIEARRCIMHIQQISV